MIELILIIGIVIAYKLGRWDECPQAWRHQWNHRFDWNNMMNLKSKYTGDLLSRKGSRCFHCGEFRWKESDKKFIQENQHVTSHEWVDPVCQWREG